MSKLKGNPWAVLVALCLGFFMILLDTTIVNIAIPGITDGLHASLDQIAWVLNAYILVYAVLLITAGRLGDIHGQKRMFLLGLVIFTLASAACGLAQNPSELVGARVVQGIGGALLTPQTLALITTIFPRERRGAAMGVWGGVAGLATIAGPTVGGLLVTDASWRWVFYLNVPVGIATFIFGAIIIPDLRMGAKHRLDLRGVLLVSAGIFAVTFGLIEGERYQWGSVWSFISIPLIIGVGVVLVGVFLVDQYLDKHEPLVPFALVRDRNFGLMNIVGAALMFGMFGLFLPLTIYLQSALHMSALKAGIVFAPMSLVSMIVAPNAGRMADKIGGKYILVSGLALFAVGMGVLDLTAHSHTHWWMFLPGLVLSGFGMGCIFAPMTTLAMHDIEPHQAGAAAGVFNTTRQVGGVIGNAAIIAVLSSRLGHELSTKAVRASSQIPSQYRPGFIAGFANAARQGLQVGAGQSGGRLALPSGVPDGVAAQIGRVASGVFTDAYVAAMRPTLLLPVVVILAAAVVCMWVRRPARSTEAQSEGELVAR